MKKEDITYSVSEVYHMCLVFYQTMDIEGMKLLVEIVKEEKNLYSPFEYQIIHAHLCLANTNISIKQIKQHP